MMKTELYAILEVELVYPFKQSVEVFVAFCNVWEFKMLGCSTRKRIASLAAPWGKFKKIWHCNPVTGSHKVPEGAEGFLAAVRVLRVSETPF
jgi:hypothetical protein